MPKSPQEMSKEELAEYVDEHRLHCECAWCQEATRQGF